MSFVETSEIVRKTFALLLVAIFLSSIDIANFQDTGRQVSRDLFYRLWAPMYPARDDKSVGIVLLDNESITGWDVYPPRYGTHASFLNAILARKPKSLFVDFAFLDVRDDPTLVELIDTFKAYHAAKIPVFLPTFSDEAASGLRPELKELASAGLIKLVSFELGRFLLGNSVYNLAPTPGPKQQLDAAAFGILKAFHPELAARLADRTEMELWWALPPDRLNCEFRAHACDSRPGSLWERIASIIQLEFAGMKLISSPEGVAAPYNPFVFANETLSGDREDAVNRTIRDKFVFYGGYLRLIEDRHPNPVYAFASERREIPGVFVHAMALENLIDLKGDVKMPRSESQVILWLHDVFVIVVIATALLFLRLTYCRPRRWAPLWLVEHVLILGLVVAVAWIEFSHLNLGPSNWAGLFAFITISRDWEWAQERMDRGLLWIIAQWRRS